MTNPLTLRQLEYLVAVADHRSFRKAAAAAGVSQPALSAQVAQVEDVLGVQVFERDRRKVLVTPAGSEIVARARTALDAAGQVVDAARSLAEPLTGTVRLGLIPTIAPFLLPAVLPAVRAAFRKLRLVLREDRTATLLALLDEGRLDAAILALPVPGDLAAVTLYREEFVLATAPRHPLAGRARLRERDLADQAVLLLDDGHCLRDQALEVCESAGAHENAELRATSLATLGQMVAGELGVTLLPELAVPALAGRGSGLVTTRFASHPPGRDIGLVWRMSSARGRELAVLGELIGERAAGRLAAVRR